MSSTTSDSNQSFTYGFSDPARTPVPPPSLVRLHRALRLYESPPSEELMSDAPPPEWVARIVFACVEAVYGRRNIQQLRTLTSQRTLQSLQIMQATRSRRLSAHQRLGIGNPRIASPVPRVLEVSVSVYVDQRAFPCALRFELRDTRWVITAIEMGPH